MDSVTFRSDILNADQKLDTDIIYHYTSPDSFIKILGKNKISLRFSRYDCVNDKSEGIYVYNIFEEIWDEMYEERNIDKKLYELVKSTPCDSFRIQKSRFDSNSDTFTEFDERDYYICCFSLNRDSLPMWNYYLKNGKYEGYNVGIHHNVFNDEEVKEKYDIKILKIIYEVKEQKKIIKERIIELVSELKDNYKVLNIVIRLLLETYKLQFKKSCFAHEEEVRAILSVPKNRADKEYIDVKYISSRGYIVPYVLINDLNKERLASITIGPLSEKEISESVVRDFLLRNNYDLKEIEIFNSEIPIRF